MLSALLLRLLVAPRLSATLADFGRELPWVTRAFASGWLGVALAVGGALFVTLLSRWTTVGSVVTGVLLVLATVVGFWVATTSLPLFLMARNLH